MKPEPSETAALLQRVRQQLILAQVRIMELEDIRDELSPKLVENERLLHQAQSMADQAIGAADHLAKVHADLQAHAAHLRHLQHVSHESLTDTRQQLDQVNRTLAETSRNLLATQHQGNQLQTEIVTLAGQNIELKHTIGQLSLEITAANSTTAARQERIQSLDRELRAVTNSRSWRWTAWLRAIERLFGPRHP